MEILGIRKGMTQQLQNCGLRYHGYQNKIITNTPETEQQIFATISFSYNFVFFN